METMNHLQDTLETIIDNYSNHHEGYRSRLIANDIINALRHLDANGELHIWNLNILPNNVEIAGELKSKQSRGMAAHHDANKTFTGNVLFTSEIRENSYDKSIEQKWKDAKVMDDVVVWRSNGQIPFADMLLDFVQIGQIDMEMAERSANQKNVELSESLKHLDVDVNGSIVLKKEGFAVSEARADK